MPSPGPEKSKEFMMATVATPPLERLLLPGVYYGTGVELDGGEGIDTAMNLAEMFNRYTVRSLFNPPGLPQAQEPKHRETLYIVFRWMLAASAWQGTVERLERDFIGIRQGIAAGKMENEQAFRSLTGFRRSLIDAHRLFVETKGRIVAEIASVSSWVERHKKINEKSPAARFKQQADARNLPRTLEKLDETTSTIMASLNEEIQLLIGYAQVQDAKLMRQQTTQTVRQTELALDLAKSTKQQAEWTILLAGLAAFYLPLTLVTGIYEMNIREINNGDPSKNWVLGSWAVAFVLTIGGCAVG